MSDFYIPNDERVALAEVDYIIHHMNSMYLNKIPQKLQDCFAILKKQNVQIYVDPHVPLEQQGLKEYTLYFLMILNLKYWCNDERRRDILARLEKNQNKYEDKINNIFEQADSLQEASNEEIDTSKPKNIITISNKKNLEEGIENAQEEPKIDENNVEQGITKKDENNFFSKLINKIKSFISKFKK